MNSIPIGIFILVICLIRPSFQTLQSHYSYFQTGIQSLILPRETPLALNYSIKVHPFTITFNQLFERAPFSLVAPIGCSFQSNQNNQNGSARPMIIKIQMDELKQNKIEIRIYSYGNANLAKISYLLLDKDIAANEGFHLFTFQTNIDANSLSNGIPDSLKITQIFYDFSTNEKIIHRESTFTSPVQSINFEVYIFANELRMLQQNENQFNLAVFKEGLSIEINFISSYNFRKQYDQFPSYSLLLKQQREQGEILMEYVEVSSSSISPFQEIKNKKSIFIGLKDFKANKEWAFQLNINLYKSYNSYYISPSSNKDSTTSNFLILSINEKSSSQFGQLFPHRLLLTCTAPTFITTYQNHWTIWVDPTNTSSQTCQPCPTGCYNCVYCSNCLRFVNCTLCRTGFNYVKLNINNYPSNQMVCTCPSGTQPNATTNTCMGCTSVIPNCGSCKTYNSGHYSATCATCNSGYFAVQNSGSWGGYTECQPCTGGCSSCTGNTSCATCATGLSKVNGTCKCSTSGTFYSTTTSTCTTCVLAVANCVTCVAASTTTTCSVCATGFYVTSGTCTACSTNCNGCTSTACTSCAATFVASGTSCICDATAQMFLNTVTNKCASCSTFVTNCIACVSSGTVTCSTCTSGTYLTGNTCLACPTSCLTCSSAVTCITCINNLIVIGGACTCDTSLGSYEDTTTHTCISCSDKIPLCSSCNYVIATNSLTCSACTAGNYLLTSTSCDPCPSTCTSCTTSSICDACITGYQLDPIAFTCDCINCVTCSLSGLTDCAACSIISFVNVCTQCIPSSYLDALGACQDCQIGCATCSSSTVCLTCSSPFIPSNPAGQCVCNSLILQYYNPVTFTCDTCSSIIPLCTSCSSSNYITTCLSCPVGNYVNGNACTSCTYPCTACSSAAVCSTCTASYTLIGSSCVCDNANNIYYDTGSTLCVSCTAITDAQCLSCALQPLATSTSGVKCASCLPGYFADLGTYLCTACPSTCITCTSLISCDTCLNTFSLINGQCICDTTLSYYLYRQDCSPCQAIFNYCLTCQNATGTLTCTHCVVGTYMSINNDACILCPLNCDICTAVSCTTCSSGYMLNAFSVCECKTTCLSYTTADPSCVDCNLAVNITANTSTLQCLACKAKTFDVSLQNCNACPTTCITCSDYVTCLTCATSFSLINNDCVCNSYFNQVLYNSLCYPCSSLIAGCETCSIVAGTPTCTSCADGWGFQSGLCTLCGIGCYTCSVTGGIPTCTQCSPNYNDIAGTCTAATICDPTLRQYYNTVLASCALCMDNCKTCYQPLECVECKPTFVYSKDTCICNSGQNYFYDSIIQSCVLCTSSPSLANCDICQASTANFANGIECLECAVGYYVSAGVCLSCLSGCEKCTSSTSCCSCNVPAWTMSSGTCVCDNSLSYFTDGFNDCLPCTIANCTVCSSLTQCLVCNMDSFINGFGLCQLSVCGNGIAEGIQACDDGNLLNGDGCSSSCAVESFYFCVNTPPPSICTFDHRLNIKVKQIISQCNQIVLNFQIYPYHDYYNSAYFGNFLIFHNVTPIYMTGYTQNRDTVSYSFTFNETIQGNIAAFYFDPSTLNISQTSNYPMNNITFEILPTNNILAIYYQSSTCESKKSIEKLTQTIEYASYGILFLSALPCKIVGLQLFGVLQLTFLSVGSMDNVNMLMSPLMGLKGVNGFSFDLGKDQTKKRLLQSSSALTPQRIDSIGYRANFLRNCNFMLITVIAVILVASILYLSTYFCKKCAPSLHSVSKRLIKEILLTLILFNCLNFAYSVGIHFRYASTDDSLYTLGTVAAVLTLILPILMAVALSMSAEQGFGEFKDKLKGGCIEKAYFVVTIIYRMCLGLYMSSSNENQLSTLIVLGISILFLLYNLVNLPFTKAYHNYRANICHLTQFICLFIAMYYRSMKSTATSTDVATIYSPVYLEYCCIMISLVVSLIILIYEIYLWVKQCWVSRERVQVEHEHHSRSDVSQVQNKMNHNLKSIQSEMNQHQQISVVMDENDIYA